MDEVAKKALGLQNNGFIKEAIQIYEEAIKKGSNSQEFAEYYGAALVTVGRSQEAKVYLKKALNQSIEKPQVLNNLATANRNLFLFEEGLLNVKSALKFKPNYRDAWINRGNLHADLQQWQESVNCYQNAIKLDSSECEPYLSLGQSLLHAHQFETALKTYQKAQAKFDDVRAIIGQLVCYRAMESYDTAIEFIKSLYEANQTELYAFEYVQTLWMAKKIDEANALLSVSLQQYNHSDMLNNLKSLIEND